MHLHLCFEGGFTEIRCKILHFFGISEGVWTLKPLLETPVILNIKSNTPLLLLITHSKKDYFFCSILIISTTTKIQILFRIFLFNVMLLFIILSLVFCYCFVAVAYFTCLVFGFSHSNAPVQIIYKYFWLKAITNGLLDETNVKFIFFMFYLLSLNARCCYWCCYSITEYKREINTLNFCIWIFDFRKFAFWLLQ